MMVGEGLLNGGGSIYIISYLYNYLGFSVVAVVYVGVLFCFALPCWGSNPGPHACQANAPPLSYIPKANHLTFSPYFLDVIDHVCPVAPAYLLAKSVELEIWECVND